MAGRKKVDPIKQREKRAKIAAAIGGVLFIAVAAYEVPSMMSALNKKPPPGANATDAGNRNPDGSIPLPSVATSTGLAGNGQLADTDVPPAASDTGELVSFSVFDTKNPFVPQVTDTTATPTAQAPPSTADKPGADVPPGTTTSPTTTTPVSAIPPTSTAPTTTTAAPPPSVRISVNGVVSRVGVDGTFPTGSPVFRLVSFTTDSAEIGIVGGTYAAGNQTLTLQLGHSVTLENTTDQKMYKLQLVATH